MIKRFGIAIALFGLILLFAGCNSNSPLIGTWRGVDAWEDGFYFTFNRDGSGLLRGGEWVGNYGEEPFSWEVLTGGTADWLVATRDGDVRRTTVLNLFEVSPTTLILVDNGFELMLDRVR